MNAEGKRKIAQAREEPLRVNPWPWKPGAIVPEWLRVRTDTTAEAKNAYGILIIACDEDGYVRGNLRELLNKRGGFDLERAVRALAELVRLKLIRVVEGKVWFLVHPWMTGEEQAREEG